MNPRSRFGAAVAAVALAPVLMAAPAEATPAQAASTTSWLADQLPAGSIAQSSGYPDYGLTIDFALGFLGNGTEQASVEKIFDALAQPATFSSYTTGDDFVDASQYSEIEDSQYANATSKLAAAVQLAGRDATAFGGHDLIAEVEQVTADDGPSVGRIKDVSAYGDYSNSIGQSFAVRALSTAGSDEATAAADYLVKQQCDSGVFSISMTDAGCTTGGTPSVDTTAFAIDALVVAREQGYTGAQAAITRAVAYLVGVQATDGSFADNGTANTNSTGLAAWALDTAGESAAAERAGDFVADLQRPTGADAGAIAFDRAAFAAAPAGGISDTARPQWIRASAQAVLGLTHASEPEAPAEPGPVATLKLKLSTSTPKQGDTLTITATGQDADGRSTGDVSDELTLKSSVASDTIEGNTVTFNHASPHTITATHVPTGTTAQVTVEVTPLAVDSPDPDDSDDPVGGSTGGGPAGSGTTPVAADLPDTGSTLSLWYVALSAALVAAGAGLLLLVRRRSSEVE